MEYKENKFHIETIREHMQVDCDLTCRVLFEGIKKLPNLFKIRTRNFVIMVSIEQLIAAVIIERELAQIRSFYGFGKAMLFNSNLIKETWGKHISFICVRSLEEDSWEISSFENNKQYILYSNGT